MPPLECSDVLKFLKVDVYPDSYNGNDTMIAVIAAAVLTPGQPQFSPSPRLISICSSSPSYRAMFSPSFSSIAVFRPTSVESQVQL